MAVNPKKLRPYDQPPKVRRPIIPNEPDNAATAFLVAALVWFLVATGIGVLWTALQLFPDQLTLRLSAPTFSGVEDWPHPIVMMVLRNIRIQPDGAPQTCN